MSRELENFFADLDNERHPHGCLIYDDLDCFREIGLAFIRDGLQAHEKCIMVVDRYSWSMIEKDFRNAGLDTAQLINDGTLTILAARRVYNTADESDPSATSDFWKKEVESASAEGFSSLRVIAEVLLAGDHSGIADKFLHFDNQLNKRDISRFSVKSLCVYDKSSIPPSILKNVIKAHPLLIYNNEIFSENIHYVPPEISLNAEDRDAQEVECWLANLSRNNENILALRENEKKFRKLFRNAPIGYQSLDSRGNFIEDITGQRRQQEEYEKQQQIISLNNRIANTFLTSAKEDLFNDVLDHVLDTLGSRFGYFGYIDDQGNLACPSLTRDIWESCEIEDKDIIFPKEKWGGLWGHSLLELKPMIANEKLETPDGHIQLDCAMAVPIIHRGALIGQFVVANKPGGFQEFDLELLEKAAAQTGPILFGLLQGERQHREKLMLEQQYLQAQKMESVGRLAGGIAHDLNNMLSPILGYGEILAEDLGMEDPRYHSASQIVEAGMRAGTMVRQLLAFSRKQTLEFKQVNLNSLLNKFEHLLRRTIREDIAIDMILADAVPSVRGDIGQLEQVIMNLSVNAQDAIPGDGIMVFETDVVDVDKSYFSSHDSILPGKYVMLAVSDTGGGMDGATQAQIFEPFFTTKGEHKGTGLGMATVYGIIKQHDGFISVYSELGEGTTIKVYLPISNDSPVVKNEQQESARIQGSETILLVEDDERVGKTVQDMLKRSGYNVLTARNGNEALKRLAIDGDTLALLITDIVMPEMDGRRLAEQVQQEYPEVKILFMSGYSDDVISRRGIFKTGINFIQKPFTAHMLLTKVREVLPN